MKVQSPSRRKPAGERTEVSRPEFNTNKETETRNQIRATEFPVEAEKANADVARQFKQRAHKVKNGS